MKNLFSRILSVGISSENNIVENELIKYTNQYVLLIVSIFFVCSVFCFFLTKNILHGFVFSVLFLLFLFIFVASFLRKKPLFVFSVFVVLGGVIFYYDSYVGKEAGIYLFYFPYILAAPILFDPIKDKKYIIAVFSIAIILFFVNSISNYSLFFTPDAPHDPRVFFIVLPFVILLGAISVFFIFCKKTIADRLTKEKFDAGALNSITAISKLAKENSPDFFTAYVELYPDFCDKLLERNSSLSKADMKLCALIKLGFTTKQIAQNINLSVRAVEGRKYRLRKKLNYVKEKDMIVWMNNLDVIFKNDYSMSNLLGRLTT